MSAHRSQRDSTIGPGSRGVAVPDDIDDLDIEKASGLVELPLRVRWSHPRRVYDLDLRSDRALVYEQVLSEGTDDDVQRFVRPADLIDLWDELVLPEHVRRAWTDWLETRRGC